MTLALTLGGYTAAESATQRADVAAGLQLKAQVEAQAHRQAVEAERQRAVATAEDALADAEAVKAVAAPAVAEADLAPLAEAVERLDALLAEVPQAPSAVERSTVDPADTATETPVTVADAPAVAVDREVRASRTAARAAVPGGAADDGAAAEQEAAEKKVAEKEAAEKKAADAEAAAEAEQVEKAADEVAVDPERTAGDGGVDDATGAPTPADDAEPDDALAARIMAAVARVTEVAAQVQATADANVAAQRAAEAAAAAQAKAEAEAAAAAAAAAAEKAAQRASLDAYANGQIPAGALCDIGGGHELRCDAADALAALDAAYQATFGVPLSISDSYRSYAAQVACRRTKGGLCAVPGTSNHGRGVAVDLAGGVQTFGTSQHAWMEANAGQFGWDLPDWASIGGSKPEPWHWEYIG